MQKKLFFIVSIIMMSFFSLSAHGENFNMQMEIRVPNPEEPVEEEGEEPRRLTNDTFYSPSEQKSRQFSWAFFFYPEALFTFHYNNIPQGEDSLFTKDGSLALETHDRPGTYHFMSLDPENQSSEIYLDISQRGSASFEYFFPPTLHFKEETTALSIYGWANAQQSLLIILENNGEKTLIPTLTSSTGYYQVFIPTNEIEAGDYMVTSIYSNAGNTGEEKTLFFSLSPDKEIEIEQDDSNSSCPYLIGDFNKDCRVNYMDLDYLRQRAMISDLNHDTIIDLVDYSIFAYFWTS